MEGLDLDKIVREIVHQEMDNKQFLGVSLIPSDHQFLKKHNLTNDILKWLFDDVLKQR